MSTKAQTLSTHKPNATGRMHQEKSKSIYSKDVILVMAASFCFMFGTMFNNPLINGYAESLGANSVLAGVIVGIMSFAAMFLRPIAGNLTDKFSKFQLSFIGGILIFLGSWAIFSLLMGSCSCSSESSTVLATSSAPSA